MTVIYRHPRIWTGDPARPWATALLVDGERVVAAGDARQLATHTTGSIEVDLPGALVIPGLHDAHIHSASLARDLASVDLRTAGSLEEALEMVRRYASGTAPDGWVFGGGWDINGWAGHGAPSRLALDAVTGDRPVALASSDGHAMWVSSAALQAAGIDRGSPDPVGGRIERDAAGEPTGVLREAAGDPLQAIQSSAVGGSLEPLLERCQQVLLSLGLTSITDIDGEDARAGYRSLRDGGRLALRVTKSIPMAVLDAAIAQGRATGQGDDWLRVGPVKLFSDGALGSHTAYMSHELRADPGNHGMARLGSAEIAELAGKAVRAGIAVATHAIGDAANRAVLDAYAHVLAETPTALRLRVEHAQHLRPVDVERFARLGVVASMQPAHCTGDIDLVDDLLAGQDLVSYGWRSLLRAGAVLAFGSDAPFGAAVKEPNPMFALYAAVTRMRADGTPAGGWQPHERLTMAEALRAHTVGSAYAAGEETSRGTLAAGMLADFVALDTDILGERMLERAPERIHAARAVVTVVGGRIRWQSGT